MRETLRESPIDDLFLKTRGLIKPGVYAISDALKCLSCKNVFKKPHFLVGGTNGKGTTSGFIYALSSSRGLYTSPHIRSIRERYLTPGGMPSHERVGKIVTEIKRNLSERLYDDLSFFDVATLISFCLFEDSDVQSFVLEVGLGGRLDSTNCSDPFVSIVTSIGLDHQEYLGNSLPEIAREKAGIFRPGRPVILGGSDSIPDVAMTTLLEHAETLKSPCFISGKDFGFEKGRFWSRPEISEKYGEIDLQFHFEGWPRYLQNNLSLALMAELIYRYTYPSSSYNWPEYDPLDYCRKNTPSFQGRMQEVQCTLEGRDFSYLVDVGHNRQCINELIYNLKSSDKKHEIAFTTMADKPWVEMVHDLKESNATLYFFQTSLERSLKIDEFKSRFPDVQTFPNFSELADFWMKESDSRNLVVTGSVMGMNDVFEKLESLSSFGSPEMMH